MEVTSNLRFVKDEVSSKLGLVTASTPQAGEAGRKMLRLGGNAIDAGVAIGFCNTVLEPYLAALSGLGFMLVYNIDEDKVVALDFNTRAPKSAKPDMFKVVGESAPGGTRIFEVEGRQNSIGAKAVTVPATLSGFCLAHELYGKLPLSKVIEPSMNLASEGFSLGWDQALILSIMMREGGRNNAIDSIWYPGGFPPAPGEKIVQPDLGRTLKQIASVGPSFVYNGELTNAIIKEVQTHGGLLSAEDLAAYKPVLSKPIKVEYKDYSIATVPTPSGGITVLEALNILENFELSSLGHNSADYIHIILETSRHAFADRYSLLGDWEAAEIPIEEMLSKQYAAELATSINMNQTSFPIEGEEPWIRYLNKPIHEPSSRKIQGTKTAGKTTSNPVMGETTHFNAVDSKGNALCCTHTPGFNCGIMPPGTGFYLTAAMGWFIPKPGYPNSIAGWKRPLMNMAPLMVLRDGIPVLLQGAPGSRRIINRNLQVVLNVIDFGMGPQEAVAAPTVDASGLDSLVDSRISSESVNDLKSRGHRVKIAEEGPGMSVFARPSAILIDREQGLLRGGVDVFRRSVALAE